jgi:hypothetical protein
MGAFQIGKIASRIVSVNKLDLADNNFTLDGTVAFVLNLLRFALLVFVDFFFFETLLLHYLLHFIDNSPCKFRKFESLDCIMRYFVVDGTAIWLDYFL